MTEDSDTLYRKYRPGAWDAVIGQDAVVKSIRSVLRKGTNHSFAFTGPSGCGKTTLARICAAVLGSGPGDIVEKDAATYTGVDDMRELTQGLMYRPLGQSTIKAIILDEVHSLSKNAWQSLLKVLEEPPSYVYWFLCTTEPTKIPATIKTRCVSYELKPVAKNLIFDLLAMVADKEEFKATDKVLDLCAIEAYGSPRQALVNLAVCANVTDAEEAAGLLKSAGAAPEAIDLARLLIKGTTWDQVTPLLQKLKEQNPESVRIVVRNYFMAVALNSKSEQQTVKLLTALDAFSTPCNSQDGIAPIVLAVGKYLYA